MGSLFGHILFDGFATGDLVFVGALYFGACFLKGVFGIGTMPPLVIFGAWVFEPHDAVIVATLANAATQFQFVGDMRRDAERKMALPMIVAYGLTLIVGVWIFGRLDVSGLSVVLGLCLGGLIAAESLGLVAVAVRRLEGLVPALGMFLGAIGGLLAGVAGAGGIVFLSLYIKTKVSNARRFRATMLLISTVVLSWRILILAVAGFITVPLMMEGLFLLPLALTGAWLGSRLFRAIGDDRFLRYFNVVLMMAAASLVWRGMAGITS